MLCKSATFTLRIVIACFARVVAVDVPHHITPEICAVQRCSRSVGKMRERDPADGLIHELKL